MYKNEANFVYASVSATRYHLLLFFFLFIFLSHYHSTSLPPSPSSPFFFSLLSSPYPVFIFPTFSLPPFNTHSLSLPPPSLSLIPTLLISTSPPFHTITLPLLPPPPRPFFISLILFLSCLYFPISSSPPFHPSILPSLYSRSPSPVSLPAPLSLFSPAL